MKPSQVTSASTDRDPDSQPHSHSDSDDYLMTQCLMEKMSFFPFQRHGIEEELEACQGHNEGTVTQIEQRGTFNFKGSKTGRRLEPSHCERLQEYHCDDPQRGIPREVPDDPRSVERLGGWRESRGVVSGSEAGETQGQPERRMMPLRKTRRKSMKIHHK